eukprot:scpid37799/ scgid34226/ 
MLASSTRTTLICYYAMDNVVYLTTLKPPMHLHIRRSASTVYNQEYAIVISLFGGSSAAAAWHAAFNAPRNFIRALRKSNTTLSLCLEMNFRTELKHMHHDLTGCARTQTNQAKRMDMHVSEVV